MEKRQIKFYAKGSNAAAIHALPGHFATSNSHINYYIDITSLKTRINEAKEVAKVLASRFTSHITVDTIVCMDGTEVIGAFLSEEMERRNILSTINQHKITLSRRLQASIYCYCWLLPQLERPFNALWNV